MTPEPSNPAALTPAPAADTVEAMLHCPQCSRRLEERGCKLRCPQCGYYLSCSDYI